MNAVTEPLRSFENPQKGERCTIVESSTETGGAYTLFRLELAPGGGVDDHFHNQRHEYFEILEGTLEVVVDGTLHRLSPGDRAEVPPGAVHSFHNRGDEPAVFEAKITPGHTGFENMMRVGAGLAREGKVDSRGIPKGFGTIALMVEWGETRLPGLFWRAAQPLIRWGYKRATARGLDRELLQRYGGELP